MPRKEEVNRLQWNLLYNKFCISVSRSLFGEVCGGFIASHPKGELLQAEQIDSLHPTSLPGEGGGG